MEFKDTMKDARNKLELATESAMPCEARNLGHGARCEHDSSTCENNNPGFQVTILNGRPPHACYTWSEATSRPDYV